MTFVKRTAFFVISTYRLLREGLVSASFDGMDRTRKSLGAHSGYMLFNGAGGVGARRMRYSSTGEAPDVSISERTSNDPCP
jgi:hypothetical protein